MSAITDNPIKKIEYFVNRHYNYVIFIRSEIENPRKGIDLTENQANLLCRDSWERYLPKNGEQSDLFDYVNNALKGILINSDSRQIEAFKKVISGQIRFAENEISRLMDLFNEKQYSNTVNYIKSNLHDFELFKNRYYRYFEKNENPQPEPKKKQATSLDSKYHVVNGEKWNISDRFDLLEQLGFVQQLEDSGLTTEEVRDILAIVLRTTPENARKTRYGTTRTQSNQIEQIEAYKTKFRSPKKP